MIDALRLLLTLLTGLALGWLAGGGTPWPWRRRRHPLDRCRLDHEPRPSREAFPGEGAPPQPPPSVRIREGSDRREPVPPCRYRRRY